MFLIRKTIELDAGHRVPYHASKCRRLHGHRYVVTAIVAAPELVPAATQRPDAEMVMDFGVIKQALQEVVHDPFDHKLILWAQDPLGQTPDFLMALENAGLEAADGSSGVMWIPCIPTAEALAQFWGEALARRLEEMQASNGHLGAAGLRLAACEVKETPTAVALWYATNRWSRA